MAAKGPPGSLRATTVAVGVLAFCIYLSFWLGLRRGRSAAFSGISERVWWPDQVSTRGAPVSVPAVTSKFYSYRDKVQEGRRQHPTYGHSIVSIQLWEAEFVVEWLNYHIWLGFDHVFIYIQDRHSAGLRELLADFQASGYLTLIQWSHSPGDQRGAYLNWLNTYSAEAESGMFLDADEFVVLCERRSISDYYNSVGFATPAAIGNARSVCLMLWWYNFGTSDLPTHPHGVPVTTTYFKRRGSVHTQLVGKVAVAGRGRINLQPHGNFWHHCGDGFHARSNHRTRSNHTQIHINHYKLRYGSEGIQRRLDRGTSEVFANIKNQYHNREPHTFRNLNEAADATLLTILKFIPDLLQPSPTRHRKASQAQSIHCQLPTD